MFVDRVRIRITPGAGGNGCCSFRREKYVPNGGPNGGDGGRGGDVYFVAEARNTSLLNLRYHSHWKGLRGAHGQGSDCHGRNGLETLIAVPVGTLIRDWETKDILCDLAKPDERYLATKGMKGGKGNARFASATNRAPRFAELGETGEELEFLLELKLIAELGIVGLPNAGKSTFLSRVTAARPKIADYPFTTLSPNLGVVPLSDHRTLTVADIPGIIEGAAQGKGLGHDFLRHIERTKVLLFLIDTGDEAPLESLATLEEELRQHSDVFASRPRFVAFNKADLPDNRARFEELAPQVPEARFISAVTGEGTGELLNEIWERVQSCLRAEAEVAALDTSQEVEYTYVAPYKVTEVEGGFEVKGERVERAVKMTDFRNDEAVVHLVHVLEKMGVFKTLKRLGAQEGQSVILGGVELEYHPD